MMARTVSLRSRAVGGICAAISVVIVAASCGVQTGSGSFERIDDEDVPNRLADPTTTSTTTTSTTTIPIDPPAPTTEPPDTADAQFDPVKIFFVLGDRLTSQPVRVPASSTVSELIDVVTLLLESGPTGESARLFDNRVAPGLLDDFSLEGGVLTVDLDKSTFEQVRSTREQREAIAQIVLTFLSSLTGVGNVQFTMDGDVLTVPTGSGISTDEPVSLDDYQNMLVDVDPPDSTPSDTDPDTSVDTTEP